MIIEIKVANYRSINEEQTLSFVADRATRHPDNLIKRPGYRLLKAVGLFGANASGKSNFIKAIGAMSTFVRDSATKMNDGDPIEAADPYRLDPATRDKPSRFEITFVIDGTIYTYGFAADIDRVHKEWLSAKSENNEKEVFGFERIYNADTNTYSGISTEPKGIMAELILNRTRNNALVLAVGAQQNVKELLPVYRFIRSWIWTFDMTVDADDLVNEIIVNEIMETSQESEIMWQSLSSLLKDADTGIEAITIEDGRPTTYHSDNKGRPVKFDLNRAESAGTKRFFAIVIPLLDALVSGAFIVIDEIGASMHPLLTRKLLELFQSPEANPNGAQLLFTTHDAVMLDSVLFRRDQIWLSEKCDGASTFFSLADIEPPIRSTESFLRNYLAGRYGGTPYLGRAFSQVNTLANK